MSDCDHLVGYSVTSVTNSKTGAVITTWQQQMRVSEHPSVGFWRGDLFQYCPLCGFKFPPKREGPPVMNMRYAETPVPERSLQGIIDAHAVESSAPPAPPR